MIIGLGHKKQVGKDTTAKILLNILYCKEEGVKVNKKSLSKYLQIPYHKFGATNWTTMAFADNLKRAASDVFNVAREAWDDLVFKASLVNKYNLTGREILQKVGEMFRKEISPDIWVNSLFESYDSLKYYSYYTKDPVHPNLIITDVRMPNEVQAIKDRGGILIRIDRDTKYKDNHISETALEDYNGWDYIIDNNGTLEELIDKVEELYDRTAGFGLSK